MAIIGIILTPFLILLLIACIPLCLRLAIGIIKLPFTIISGCADNMRRKERKAKEQKAAEVAETNNEIEELKTEKIAVYENILRKNLEEKKKALWRGEKIDNTHTEEISNLLEAGLEKLSREEVKLGRLKKELAEMERYC